jgi:hypothetical protein
MPILAGASATGAAQSNAGSVQAQATHTGAIASNPFEKMKISSKTFVP